MRRRMAVGVEPIYWMAPVVQRKDMAVGKTANASRLVQIPLVRCVQYAGIEQACHKKRYTEEKDIEGDFKRSHIFQRCLVDAHDVYGIGKEDAKTSSVPIRLSVLPSSLL